MTTAQAQTLARIVALVTDDYVITEVVRHPFSATIRVSYTEGERLARTLCMIDHTGAVTYRIREIDALIESL